MRQVINRVIIEFLGVVGLAVLLLSNSAPVFANEELGNQLIVTINNKTIAENTVERVTPKTSYKLIVYNMGDMEHPLSVDLGTVLDEQGKMVNDKMIADDMNTIYTFIPANEDTGKTFTITFKTRGIESKSITVKLKVNEIAKKITINRKSYTMNVKHHLALKATVSPLEAVNKEVIWKTSNAKVATVRNGNVKALAPGQCTITASLKDGSLPVTCRIIVRHPTLNYKSKGTAIKKSFTLKVLYLDQKVVWKTSNSKIATVKNGVVTAKKTGKVTITAKSGAYTMTCQVKVTNPLIINSSNKGVEGITVTSGFTRILKIKDGSGTVTWKSSNTKIATVNDGVVKGGKTGSCYVYATVDGKKLKCKVTTKANVLNTTPIRNGRRMKKGRVSLSNASIYYSNGKLIYKCYAVNSTSYKKVIRYNNINISIYADHKLVAKQSYKNVKLDLKKYKSKALTFTFDIKNVKRKVNLRTSKIVVEYNYGYQYLN